LDFTSLYHINRPEFYNGVGEACSQYNGYFQSAGDKHGIDPTILAFIAMQESSCNAMAGGPTPGLMQVSVWENMK
jgi:membrane-bound lytic murein transglycosylase MltF